MARDPARRFAAALRALDPRPGQHLIEVGCGHGVAVTLLCAALDGEGAVHAIDRSPTMIAAARRRNAGAVEAGTATFETTTVQLADLPAEAFDGVLALRVRELWTDAAAVLPRIARWLRPDGRLCVVLDAPRPGGAAVATRQLLDRLAEHRYRAVHADPAPTADVVTVTARRPA